MIAKPFHILPRKPGVGKRKKFRENVMRKKNENV
jgi:hypothetical protein